MPLYDFQHPVTHEVKELFFHMDDDNKTYTDEDGVKWNRVFNPINLNATYRTFDEKRLVDEKGNPLKVQHLSEEFVRSQGFKNATDYIDYNNSVMVDREKTPEANTQKMHDQAADKDLQQKIKENQRKLEKNNEIARRKKEQTKSNRVQVKATMDKKGRATKVKVK
jgi:hypothetical protein|tara:strand:+ start:6204 stop:6701 length:498 start_codon:yes stop_codon:yes gene_type:complete